MFPHIASNRSSAEFLFVDVNNVTWMKIASMKHKFWERILFTNLMTNLKKWQMLHTFIIARRMNTERL